MAKSKQLSKQISKTQLGRILAESSFDPREPGPFKPIVDMEDPKFLRQQVIMLLHQCEGTKNIDNTMKQAITLLAIARCFSTTSSTPKHKVNPDTRPDPN